MSKRLRYQDPKVIQHLAQRFVLGLQSESVRQSVQQRSQSEPELMQAILKWQAHFNHLDALTDNLTPPSQVWSGVQHRLFQSTDNAASLQSVPWYQLPMVWLSITGTALLTFTLTFALLWSSTNSSSTDKISYLAVMSPIQSEASKLSETGNKIDFVLAAYQDLEVGKSSLRIQWNAEQEKRDLSEWVLRTVAKNDGDILELGPIDALLARPLTKTEWLAIKNSRSLQIIKQNNLVFEGPCLQLTQWQT